jgi:protein translocase SecG subunit
MFGVFYGMIIFAVLVIAFLLILLILIQEGKGGGLAALGGTKAAAVEGTTNPVRTATAYLSAMLLVCLIAFMNRPVKSAVDPTVARNKTPVVPLYILDQDKPKDAAPAKVQTITLNPGDTIEDDGTGTPKIVPAQPPGASDAAKPPEGGAAVPAKPDADMPAPPGADAAPADKPATPEAKPDTPNEKPAAGDAKAESKPGEAKPDEAKADEAKPAPAPAPAEKKAEATK